MKTVEELLYNFTKSKKLFLKRPYKDCDGYPVVLTRTGYKAYGKLTSIIYDLAEFVEGDDKLLSNKLYGLVDTLDFIIDSEVY